MVKSKYKYAVEKQKIADRKYYLKHSKIKLAGNKKWQQNNKERLSIYRKEWRSKNIDKVN